MKFKYYFLTSNFLSSIFTKEELAINKYERRPFVGYINGDRVFLFPEATIHNNKHSNLNYYEYLYECESNLAIKHRINLTNLLIAPNHKKYVHINDKRNIENSEKILELENNFSKKVGESKLSLKQKISLIMHISYTNDKFYNTHPYLHISRIFTKKELKKLKTKNSQLVES